MGLYVAAAIALVMAVMGVVIKGERMQVDHLKGEVTTLEATIAQKDGQLQGYVGSLAAAQSAIGAQNLALKQMKLDDDARIAASAAALADHLKASAARENERQARLAVPSTPEDFECASACRVLDSPLSR